MVSRRIERINHLLRQEIADLLTREVKDATLASALISIVDVETSRSALGQGLLQRLRRRGGGPGRAHPPESRRGLPAPQPQRATRPAPHAASRVHPRSFAQALASCSSCAPSRRSASIAPNPDFTGILNIHKPKGWTSHDVVAKVRGLAAQKRVGHAGTLDPMAEGVLPVLLGRATRLADVIQLGRKTYSATAHLGASTDTDDAEGTVSVARCASVDPGTT